MDVAVYMFYHFLHDFNPSELEIRDMVTKKDTKWPKTVEK